MALDVFVSYSHRDDVLRNEMSTRLAQLRRDGLINEWHDRRIGAGDDWRFAIDGELQRARVILCLVSSDFIASDYCIDVEMSTALDRAARGEAKLIPVILRACDWKSGPLGRFQALPKDGRPITSWENHDEAWYDVTLGVRNAVAQIVATANSSSLDAERRLRVTVHRAYFQHSPAAHYFVNLTNVSPRRPLEVSHVWYESDQRHIPLLQASRPLPVRLELDQSWETWIAESDLHAAAGADVSRSFRARISTGETFESSLNLNVPPVGTVPGRPVGQGLLAARPQPGPQASLSLGVVAGTAVAEALATTFVDLMRLLFVGASNVAREANERRYPSFVDMAQGHLGDIGIATAQFAAAFDPAAHRQILLLQRRLSWMLRQLGTIVSEPAKSADYFTVMRESADMIDLFCALVSGESYSQEVDLFQRVMHETGHGAMSLPRYTSWDDVFRARMTLQEVILRNSRSPTGGLIRSIADDMEQQLGIRYFLLDRLLLHAMAH